MFCVHRHTHKSLGTWTFFILTNPSSCSLQFSTAQRGTNQQSFPRPIKQIHLTHFQFSPDRHEEIQNSHGKQHLSSTRPLGHYCQANMCPKCGHSQASVHSLAATEGMAAFWGGVCVKGRLSLSELQPLFPSQKQHQVANMRPRGGCTALRHHTGGWPGSSCCILAWHHFRGFCAEQTGLLRLPLRSHLREGIV